ncbi:MAG: OmpA family protein [Pseudomonadales bacterium]|nr:OmpA family protein [Pseudomonadales bacterium]
MITPKIIVVRGLTAFLSLLGLVVSLPGFALQDTRAYGAFIEDSEWKTTGSELECGLSQAIPEFGEGVFRQKAGESLEFQLKSFNRILKPGVADLIAQGPAWKPNVLSHAIASLEVSDQPVPVQVGKPYAAIMLAQLNRGMMPTFSAFSSEALNENERVKVVMSSANFQEAYADYIGCLSHLLPVNFKQIARSAIFFNTNDASLSEEIQEQLDLIARYVKADKKIKHIFIDGHTDDAGDKAVNVKLSKIRATAVQNYFKQAGVESNLMTLRYHGGKYPALKNNSDENRARNRRVTIRLERN